VNQIQIMWLHESCNHCFSCLFLWLSLCRVKPALFLLENFYIFSAEYCTCTCIWFIAYFGNLNTDFKVCVYSLEDVLMEESRLYLIFEFLSMDLKKYLDSLGPNKLMDTNLVRSYLYQVKLKIYYFQKCS
jgi:hypothetical protein